MTVPTMEIQNLSYAMALIVQHLLKSNCAQNSFITTKTALLYPALSILIVLYHQVLLINTLFVLYVPQLGKK